MLGLSGREWIPYKPNPSPMTQNPYTRPHGHQPPSQELIELMEHQLAWLSYHALELSVQRLLINLSLPRGLAPFRAPSCGVAPTTAASIWSRSDKTPVSMQSVVIQLKRREQPISRSVVLEFRGALDYYEAQSGILITTSRFAPPALETAAALSAAGRSNLSTALSLPA